MYLLGYEKSRSFYFSFATQELMIIHLDILGAYDDYYLLIMVANVFEQPLLSLTIIQGNYW